MNTKKLLNTIYGRCASCIINGYIDTDSVQRPCGEQETRFKLIIGRDAIFFHNTRDNGLPFELEREAMRLGLIEHGNYTYQFVFKDRLCYMKRYKVERGANGGEVVIRCEIFKKYYVDATDDIILIYDSEDDFHDHLIDMGIIQPK